MYYSSMCAAGAGINMMDIIFGRKVLGLNEIALVLSQRP
jgi:hypothetical protein